jgi:proline dehydrogenase
LDRQTAIQKAQKLKQQGFEITLNPLGEHYKNFAQVEGAVKECAALAEAMSATGLTGNIGVKPTQLGLEIDENAFYSYLYQLMRKIKEYSVGIEIDMEGYETISSTIQIFQELHNNFPEFCLRLAVQANNQKVMEELSRRNLWNAPVRLVKGSAYTDKEYETDSSKITERYLRLATIFIREGRNPYLATVRDRRLILQMEEIGLLADKNSFELQHLYGLWPNLQKEMLARGYKVRIYIPYGHEWFSYGKRRFLFLTKIFLKSILE